MMTDSEKVEELKKIFGGEVVEASLSNFESEKSFIGFIRNFYVFFDFIEREMDKTFHSKELTHEQKMNKYINLLADLQYVNNKMLLFISLNKQITAMERLLKRKNLAKVFLCFLKMKASVDGVKARVSFLFDEKKAFNKDEILLALSEAYFAYGCNDFNRMYEQIDLLITTEMPDDLGKLIYEYSSELINGNLRSAQRYKESAYMYLSRM